MFKYLLVFVSLTIVNGHIFVQKPNKNYQACLTPSGVAGHCKHIQHCMQPQFKQNFWKIFEHICVIEKFQIGICCPDEASERIGPEFLQNLPASGDEAPVWGIADADELAPEEKIVNRPEDRGCGLATKQFPKITGGRPADPGEWPWMVALMVRDDETNYCGGVLISDRHVLTAAHCVYRLKAVEMVVRLGEYDFSRTNDTRSRDFFVSQINIHEDFDKTT